MKLTNPEHRNEIYRKCTPISLHSHTYEEQKEILSHLKYTDDIIGIITHKELYNLFDTYLPFLNPRQERAIRMYFGLTTDHQSYSLREIAIKFNICPARVMQIIESGLKKLRRPRLSRYFRTFCDDYV